MGKIISYPFLHQKNGGFIEIIEKTGNDVNHTRQFVAHRHEFIEIIWVKEGLSTQIVDNTMYRVGKDELLVIPEGVIHYEKDESYIGFVFLFTACFFSREQADTLKKLSTLHLLNQNRLLTIKTVSPILILLKLIIQAYRNKEHPYQKASLQSLFFSLMLEIEHAALAQGGEDLRQNREKKIYKDFLVLLEQNYKQYRNTAFYAQEIQIGEKTLCNSLLRVIGKSTNQIILDRVILEAKRYLSHSNKSIKEISFELGFSDSHYFSRLFKEKTSFTPKDFRGLFSQKST
ncbi:MAG: helix-turn-helix domain-containing protein [Cytophagales bacterium]|nr:MAG: helix-turn-helix domain-containing protein [Cytophagales bacterium]